MSHIKRAATKMRNEQHILEAIKRLEARKNFNVKLLKNAEPRGYGGKLYETCDIVIGLPGQYDLGLKKTEDGTYGLIADSELLNGHSTRGQDSQYIGKGACELFKEYTIAASYSQAALEGHEVETVNYLPSGGIEIIIEVPEALMLTV